MPSHDSTGAFGFATGMCRRLHCLKEAGYNVVATRVNGPGQATEVVNSLPADSVGHVTLAGHGTSEALTWGWGLGGDLQVGLLGLSVARDPRSVGFMKALRSRLDFRLE